MVSDILTAASDFTARNWLKCAPLDLLMLFTCSISKRVRTLTYFKMQCSSCKWIVLHIFVCSRSFGFTGMFVQMCPRCLYVRDVVFDERRMTLRVLHDKAVQRLINLPTSPQQRAALYHAKEHNALEFTHSFLTGEVSLLSIVFSSRTIVKHFFNISCETKQWDN